MAFGHPIDSLHHEHVFTVMRRRFGTSTGVTYSVHLGWGGARGACAPRTAPLRVERGGSLKPSCDRSGYGIKSWPSSEIQGVPHE
jgi:hypothetical protein